jgi:hypothetical protein
MHVSPKKTKYVTEFRSPDRCGEHRRHGFRAANAVVMLQQLTTASCFAPPIASVLKISK